MESMNSRRVRGESEDVVSRQFRNNFPHSFIRIKFNDGIWSMKRSSSGLLLSPIFWYFHIPWFITLTDARRSWFFQEGPSPVVLLLGGIFSGLSVVLSPRWRHCSLFMNKIKRKVGGVFKAISEIKKIQLEPAFHQVLLFFHLKTRIFSNPIL